MSKSPLVHLPLAPICFALLVASFALASPARAFWCDGNLVLVGDRSHEVRAHCGDPASEITRTESHTFYRGGVARGGVGTYYGGSADTVTVQVDIWVYDFGPTRFMEELRFEDGVLRSMTRLGRGSRRSGVSPTRDPQTQWAALVQRPTDALASRRRFS